MSEKAAKKWHAVSVTVPTEQVEAVEFALNNLESLGTEVDLLSEKNSDRRTVTAYFSDRPDDGEVRAAIANAAEIYGIAIDSDIAVLHSTIENRDWLAEWKKYWKPVEIGQFVIAAPWHEIDDSGKVIIRIEPNMAFGTGTHETTQLCLAAIDRDYPPGKSFLDVGTGTGILAIAAALLGSGTEKITAVDNDVDAVAIARANAAANGASDRIRFFDGSVDPETEPHDFVCANLTADVIVPLLPALLKITNRVLVLSGILAEQERNVLHCIPENLRYEVSRSGEWIAITVKMDDEAGGFGINVK